MNLHRLLKTASVVCILITAPTWVLAQQTDEDKSGSTTELELADGKMAMQAPDKWTTVEPKFSMIAAEFSVPRQGEDEKDGRLTIMAAGGSVEANIQRWESQFSQPDGSSADDKTTVDEMKVAGQTTHFVDISGTYADRAGGPASPPTLRENYRMLAAIIETDDMGTWFIKFYGGAETIDANEVAFEAFIKSLKIK